MTNFVIYIYTSARLPHSERKYNKKEKIKMVGTVKGERRERDKETKGKKERTREINVVS
jgi:hypothetical protein